MQRAIICLWIHHAEKKPHCLTIIILLKVEAFHVSDRNMSDALSYDMSPVRTALKSQ